MVPISANVLQMVTNIYPMVADESRFANPQKVEKIDEKISKMKQKLFGNTALADELPNSLANTGHIGYHPFYWLPSANHR